MTFGLQTDLIIDICEDSKDASYKGYVYRPPIYEKIKIDKIIVIKKGTLNDKPTLDFILEDEKGQKYVFMITAALLKSIPT